MFNYNFKNDGQALLKLADGDLAAYRFLFDRYFADLCNFLNIYLHSKEFSEEVALEIFEIVWEKRETLQIRVTFKAFLFSSVKNRAISHYRREHRNIFTTLEPNDLAIAEESNSQHFMEGEGLRMLLTMAMSKLQERCWQTGQQCGDSALLLG